MQYFVAIGVPLASQNKTSPFQSDVRREGTVPVMKAASGHQKTNVVQKSPIPRLIICQSNVKAEVLC